MGYFVDDFVTSDAANLQYIPIETIHQCQTTDDCLQIDKKYNYCC